MPYEHPQGRRVNTLAAYRPYDPCFPWLGFRAFGRTLTGEDLLAYLRALPWAAVPRIVVLDNAGLHTSRAVRWQRPALAELGIYLYYLPPYSPELNEIEALFRQIKHQEIPQRSHTTGEGLRQAVEQGFKSYHHKLRCKPRKKLRLAA